MKGGRGVHLKYVVPGVKHPRMSRLQTPEHIDFHHVRTYRNVDPDFSRPPAPMRLREKKNYMYFVLVLSYKLPKNFDAELIVKHERHMLGASMNQPNDRT